MVVFVGVGDGGKILMICSLCSSVWVTKVTVAVNKNVVVRVVFLFLLASAWFSVLLVCGNVKVL